MNYKDLLKIEVYPIYNLKWAYQNLCMNSWWMRIMASFNSNQNLVIKLSKMNLWDLWLFLKINYKSAKIG